MESGEDCESWPPFTLGPLMMARLEPIHVGLASALPSSIQSNYGTHQILKTE